MTLSNDDLIQRFLNGAESGSASRMEIQVIDGVRCIVGYGWAVYAADLTGHIAVFGGGDASGTDNRVGWAGYSSTTTKHIRAINVRVYDRVGSGGVGHSIVDARVKTGRPFRTEGVPIGEIEDLGDFVIPRKVSASERREMLGLDA